MKVSIKKIYALYLEHKKISTDSRLIDKGCLFFALRGDNFDGNEYAKGAIEAGAAFAVIDNEKYITDRALLVDNVLDTLQQMAKMHRRRFNIPVLAITGSNGKTTTKELINAVLCRKYNATATKGNLNNHIGVPLTLLDISDETQIAIVEMGANHQGEIARLCSIAEPSHGLITNIGKAHLGGFGGYDGVVKAKSELYTWLRNSGGKAFVNAGNPLLMELTNGIDRILYGSEDFVFSKGNVKGITDMLCIDWETRSGRKNIETRLVGSYNFENVMAAICTGMYFNIPDNEIHSAISNYTPSNSRSQAMKTDKNSIILDAYNANPSSMKVAIENFRQVKSEHKMVILGDMLELGDYSKQEHTAILELVKSYPATTLYTVGKNFLEIAENYHCHSFLNVELLCEFIQNSPITGGDVLIKGSRGIQLEKVLNCL